MKRQYQPTEVHAPLAASAAQLDLAGRTAFAAAASAPEDASAPLPAPVLTLAAPAGSAWWEEEEPETRTGGVCLLIA
jgi:hypothetical protein